MATTLSKHPQRERGTLGVHPKTFSLWLFIVTSLMLFGAFTSAMIVSRGDALARGTWNFFDIPVYFTISTGIILLSSICLEWARRLTKANEIFKARRLLWVTLALGIAFLLCQLEGYKALIDSNVMLSNSYIKDGYVHNAKAGGFFYIISGMHALHVFVGVIVLVFALIGSYKFKIHSRAMLPINLTATYWHFVGLLWVYLFALLTLYN